MKNTKKRVLAVFFAAIILLGSGTILPKTVRAGTGLAAIDVDLLGPGYENNDAMSATESSWSYTTSSKKLYLGEINGKYLLRGTNNDMYIGSNNAGIDVTFSDIDITSNSYFPIYLEGANSTFNLIGSNSVTSTTNHTTFAIVYSATGMVIKGDGTLSLNGSSTMDIASPLIIKENVTLSLNATSETIGGISGSNYIQMDNGVTFKTINEPKNYTYYFKAGNVGSYIWDVSGGSLILGTTETSTDIIVYVTTGQNLVVKRIPTAPIITNLNTYSCVTGIGGSFTLTADGKTPMTWSLSGQPGGVSISGSNLVVASSVPMGTYNFTVTAANGVAPNATQNFTLTVKKGPTITSTDNFTGIAGTGGSFNLTASGTTPITWSLLGAPSGVTVSGSTLKVAASVAEGTYYFIVQAANGIEPNAIQNFTLYVKKAPVITSANNYSCTSGSPGSFVLKANGTAPITWSLSGAPSGVTISDSVLNVASNLKKGKYTFTIQASNGISPNATQSFTLSILENTYSEAIISYSAVADAEYYQIYRSTNKKSGYKLVGTSTDTSFHNYHLVAGTTYYYKVRSVQTVNKKAKYGKYTAPITAVTAKLPAVGNDVTWMADKGSISFHWNKTNNMTGVQIYYATTNTKKTKWQIVTFNEKDFILQNLTPDKTYYFKIRYVYFSGSTSYSDFTGVKNMLTK